MADARRRPTEVLDETRSDGSTIIDVEPGRNSALVATSPRGALTTFITQRLPFLNLPQEARPTRPFPLGWATFTAFVLVPTILTALYFAFIASNQYVAEMRVVVRMGRATASGGGLSSIMGQMAGGGSSGSSLTGGLPTGGAQPSPEGGTSTENAHIVASYIHSRAMVEEIMKLVNLREVFSRPEADIYARLSRHASMEDLTLYWQSMVSVSLEPLSGIITIQVRAFRPQDAVELSKHVEALSEKLVNTISSRARADALRRATDEVQRAQGLLLASLQEMEKYRNREGIIDPIETAKQKGRLLAKVLSDQLEVENQLFIAGKSLAQDSNTVRALRTRAENLRRQVAQLRAEIAGEGQSANVAGALARYEEVAIQQKLAQTLYTMAENGLERARITAEAQSVYLTVFVQPGLPEDSIYPKRIQFTLLLMGTFLVAWGIGALIWASVEDHRLG